MQKHLTPEVIYQINNLPGFPAKPTAATPAGERFLLGDYLESIRVRPGVMLIADLPLTQNSVGDVRIVVAEQAWYYWTGVTWIPISGPVVPADHNPQINGQTTAGLGSGDLCYLVSPNVWARAKADGTFVQSNAVGLYPGIAGTVYLAGAVFDSVKCTTTGGLPAVGDVLYLASSTEDGGTALGKVTATPPVPPMGGEVHLHVVGTCVDNGNYSSFKFIKMAFQPSYPIVLRG